MDKKQLGNRIKGLRKLLGLNQAQFAKYLEVTPPTVNNYEAGRFNVPACTIVKLTDLGCNYNYLCGESVPPFASLDDLQRAQETIGL